MTLQLGPAAFAFFNSQDKDSIQMKITWSNPTAQVVSLVLSHSALMTKPGNLFIAKARHSLCVKLRSSLAKHQHELDTYLAMPDDIRAAFVPLLFAFEVELGGNTWAGLCMPFIQHPLCRLLSVSPKRSAPATLRRLATNPTIKRHQQHDAIQHNGIALLPSPPPETFETAVLDACCQLLNRLHQRGWVHGDTHLGNFLLCPKTWRVFLIDPERAFASTNPVQCLLDVQELIGHASGLLVSPYDKKLWDMSDVWGVASKVLHPLQSYLPVCTCFVHANTAIRKRGCSVCRSPFNTHQAALYLAAATPSLDHDSYVELLALITKHRQTCRMDMQTFVLRLKPSLPRILQHPSTALFQDMLSQESTDIKRWLKFICYHGAFVSHGSQKALHLVRILRKCRLRRLARLLLPIIQVKTREN